MGPTVRRVLKGLLWMAAAAGVLAALFLLRLVYIGAPQGGATLQFVGFVRLPKQHLLTVLDYLTVSDRQLFVADESDGSVYKFSLDGAGGGVGSSVAVFASEPAAHGVALNPSGTLAYVTRSEVNAVDVFDPATMRAVARVPVAEDPDAIIFDPLHRVLYVTNGDAHLATLIDPESHLVTGTISLPGSPEYAALDRPSGLMYQNLADLDAVAAVDVEARSLKESWPLTGCNKPSGMAVDEAARRLLIVCAANSVMVAFDLEAHRVVATVPVGGGPDSVAIDVALGRIYSTGKEGVLTVIQRIDADTYKPLESVKLHYGAHTLALDPVTHKLYVGYASLLVPARVAIFSPRK